ncbi:MAG: hypothetical protein QM571_07215, partial [Micrococcaceae bacterium]
YRKILTNSEMIKTAHEQIHDHQLASQDFHRLLNEYEGIINTDIIQSKHEILPGFQGATIQDQENQKLLTQIEKAMQESAAPKIKEMNHYLQPWKRSLPKHTNPVLSRKIATYRVIYNIHDTDKPLGNPPKDFKQLDRYKKLEIALTSEIKFQKMGNQYPQWDTKTLKRKRKSK